ncbi:hypothetical protein [Lewinella sp. 4G2]|uniref:hypothetical protein n=1 Tax=Lewinella sp. 4G2 TaxID=1803372 RepID=UPI0007B4E689|nr:hypothetical protein [Lewinella sp. 4G2]OAV44376.1 hypothetical protein A3850_007650 [Lewinella sp. 4G2]
MRILTHNQIGTHHANHNDDSVAVAELSDRHHLIAIVNGTDAGDKGYFTAALIATLLEKIAGEFALKNFAEKSSPTTGELLRETMAMLLEELNTLRSLLNLSQEALQLTATVGVLDETERRAELVVIGSGMVSCDGETIEMSQYATPDYLGNHLNTEEFTSWWAGHDKRISCENCLDLAIASLGILTFEPFSHDPYKPVTEDEIITFLLTQRNDGPVEQMFRRKIIYIEEKFGLLATDDVSVVRAFFL